MYTCLWYAWSETAKETSRSRSNAQWSDTAPKRRAPHESNPLL